MKRNLYQRVIGIVFLVGGVFAVSVYPGIQSPYAIDAGIFILCGLVLFFASFSRGPYARRPSEFDKTVGRRILLFTLMYFIYIGVSFYILYKAEAQGIDERNTLIHIGIGYIAVTGAYLLLLWQLIRERKANRIQDRAIGELPAYENSRLFSMVTESVEDSPSLLLKGVLHGEVQPGDKAWIIDKGRVYETTVEKAETADKESILSVNGKHKPSGHYPVITSMIPYRNTGWESPVTNPELFSLIEGANDHPMSGEYLSHLIYAAAHSRYLVRVNEAEKQVSFFQKLNRWLFGYHGTYIPETVLLKEENIPTCSCYTDWNAFEKGPRSKGDKNRANGKALILTFQQLADAAMKNHCPIVINPFGPSPFRLSRELLTELLNNEVYQKEFPKKNN